jgi:6-phosphogluconolactonase (cycloisomerase 2 family)
MSYSEFSDSTAHRAEQSVTLWGRLGRHPLLLILLGLTLLCSGCPIDQFPPTTKTTPTITWTTPTAITYGTALSSTQLNATASVAGTFTYTPASGTVLNAGAQTLAANFTPTDTTKYNSASATVSLTVNKATPAITWTAPDPITQGTALSATQLDATASVPGTFAYNPASGAVLNAGTQTLSVTFTPTDSTNYNSANSSVALTVNASSGGGIGPSGGTVNGFYGARVTVPAGALSSAVDIEIPRHDTDAPILPTESTNVAGAMYALTPHGTAFSIPATVQVPFRADRIPTDADPVLYKAEPGGSFAPIPTTVNGNFLSADVSNFSWVIPGYASKLPRVVYGMTADNNGNVSVSSFKITKGTGALSAPSSSAPVGSGPISITVHPSRRFLYVTNGSGTTQGAATNVPPNSISTYQLDPATGAVSGPTSSQPVNGNPISAVVHPTGKFIYVVNEVRFGTPVGNISVYTVDTATGALSAPTTTADSGGAPASAIAFSPSGEFAYVTYFHAVSTPVGNNFWDTVKTYTVDRSTGVLSGPIGSANTGDNPWALAVTPGGHFAYVASLSTQGSVAELAKYSINQSSGILTLQNSIAMSGAQPSSLAMDPEGRFLYVGRIQPFDNHKLEIYSIDPSGGGLSLVGGLLLGAGGEVGPIAVTAEPQGEFVYALDSSLGAIVPLKLDPTNGTLTPGTPITGVLATGASGGGVGDPFFFAASGTSPVWVDNCTIIVNDAFVFDGCFTPKMSTGPGSTSSNGSIGGGTPTHPPAANFTLTVIIEGAGGSVSSSPTGIDTGPSSPGDFFEHMFPSGSAVTLTATPPDFANAYDVTWSGSCSGDQATTSVSMTQDKECYLTFTPASSR